MNLPSLASATSNDPSSVNRKGRLTLAGGEATTFGPPLFLVGRFELHTRASQGPMAGRLNEAHDKRGGRHPSLPKNQPRSEDLLLNRRVPVIVSPIQRIPIRDSQIPRPFGYSVSGLLQYDVVNGRQPAPSNVMIPDPINLPAIRKMAAQPNYKDEISPIPY
jgi:hypothetical protein